MGAVGIGAAAYAVRWIGTQETNNGVPWFLRRCLQMNEKLARSYFRGYHQAPEFDESLISERTNGDIGLSGDIDETTHVVRVVGLHDMTGAIKADDTTEPAIEINMARIKALPRRTIVTELKCIEGWSIVVKWTGARLIDLAEQLGPATISGNKPDVLNSAHDILPYVALETPDGTYYVGLDTQSALHPQTLLCYEMNNKPLADEHGAPVRLVIPVKYGVKHIKRIGVIRFTASRPKDYWAEQGYDWYAGL